MWYSLAVLLLALLGRHLVRCECELIQPNANQDKPLPKLDEQFEATIIITYPNQNVSMEIEEYYDYSNNQGAIYRLNAGVSDLSLYNFATYEAFIINKGKCSTHDMRHAHLSFFKFSTPDGQGAGHISPMADIIDFSLEYGVKYIGQDRIRELDVDHWATCLNEGSSNYTAHFYFSQPHVVTPGAVNRTVPVRIVSFHSSGSVNNTVYDFTVYKPGAIADTSVFQIPRGIVCTHNSSVKREMPKLAESFTARVEYIHKDKTAVYNDFLAIDYTHKVSRKDLKLYKNHNNSYYNMFAGRAISVVHDFSAGYEYVMDALAGNCTIRPLLQNETWDDRVTDAENVVMSRGYELFHLTDIDFSYQGQRVYRGIGAQVWSALKLNFPRENVTSTMEVYFAQLGKDFVGQDAWSQTCGDDSCGVNLLGSWMRSDDHSESYEVQMHVYDYTAGVRSDPDLFDIKQCLDEPGQQLHLTFKLEGAYAQLVTDKTHVIAPAVWEQVASTCKVSVIRIAHVHFDTTQPDYTDVWFTLLDVPLVTGTPVEGAEEPLSMLEAHHNLQAAIQNSLAITVPYQDGDRELLVLKNSLATDLEVLDPRKNILRHVVHKNGHSNGSMAALGIGMFFVGIVAGGVLVMLWVRRTRNTHHRIPYTRDIDF